MLTEPKTKKSSVYEIELLTESLLYLPNVFIWSIVTSFSFNIQHFYIPERLLRTQPLQMFKG